MTTLFGPIQYPKFKATYGSMAAPVIGGLVYTYQSGSSTPAATYTDATGGTPNANPVVLDANGSANIFLNSTLLYKFIITDGNPNIVVGGIIGTILDTIDGVYSPLNPLVGSVVTNVAGTATIISTTGGTTPQIDLINTAVTPGSYTNSSLTVDAAGRLTAASSGTAPVTSVSGTANDISSTGGTTPILDLINTAVTPGSYTLTSLTVDAKGRLTAASSGSALASATALYPALGRLSGNSALPVTTTDVLAAGTLYYVPYIGNTIGLFDGVSTWTNLSFTTPALSLGVSNGMYDVFAFNNTGSVGLETLAWLNSTSRSTGLTYQNGILVKVGDTTRRYIASIYVTSNSVDDSIVNRHLWNYYNRVERLLKITESTGSWTYTTASYHQANANSNNQVDVVIGVSEDPLDLTLKTLCSNSTGGVTVSSGIGINSTTVNSATTTSTTSASAGAAGLITGDTWCKYQGFPGIGRYTLAWLEYSAATGTTTWYSNGASNLYNSGLTGFVKG